MAQYLHKRLPELRSRSRVVFYTTNPEQQVKAIKAFGKFRSTGEPGAENIFFPRTMDRVAWPLEHVERVGTEITMRNGDYVCVREANRFIVSRILPEDLTAVVAVLTFRD